MENYMKFARLIKNLILKDKTNLIIFFYENNYMQIFIAEPLMI